MRSHPTFQEEQLLHANGYRYVAGVDEVGRGSFAGPVVAAAVILPLEFPYHELINDSKLLNPSLRSKLARIIKLYALSYSISEVSVESINKIGIGKAAQKAFFQSVCCLKRTPDFILVDGFPISGLKPKLQKHIIKGDRLSLSIAAASIIAKVYRDSLMEKLHEDYPLYSFRKNKGYGTKEHREAIKNYGLCKIHRTSFNLSKFLTTNI